MRSSAALLAQIEVRPHAVGRQARSAADGHRAQAAEALPDSICGE